MHVGLHVELSKGHAAAAEYAARLGCTSVQFFSGNPKSYRLDPPDPAALGAFAELRREAGLVTSAIHTSYLINLASEDDKIARNSLRLLEHDLRVAAAGAIDFVNTHLGSYGKRERREGFTAVVAKLEHALEAIGPGVFLVLENSAGAGQLCGGTIEELAELIRAIGHPALAICLDTAHLWAAGYAIDSEEGVDRLLDLVDREISLERVKMFHFNDTLVPLGGHKDRHHHIGEGLIGLAGFRKLLSTPELAGRTAILETPGEEADDVRNLETIRSLRAEVAA
jgi:deoxyribonuclease-4